MKSLDNIKPVQVQLIGHDKKFKSHQWKFLTNPIERQRHKPEDDKKGSPFGGQSEEEERIKKLLAKRYIIN